MTEIMGERMMLLEVIACSVADALEAEKGGAGRLEIITGFERGGLTPPLELIRNILAAVNLPVRVMLRESDGFQVRGDDEVKRLCDAAHELSRFKVDGVVLGFVQERKPDLELTARILSCAPHLKATFHHAFEETRDKIGAVNELKNIKQVDRILAHGGRGGWTRKGEQLALYQRAAEPEIIVLAGGGLDARVIESLCKIGALSEFHVGRAARENGVVRAALVNELVKAMACPPRESNQAAGKAFNLPTTRP